MPTSGRAYVTGKTSGKSWKPEKEDIHKKGFIFLDLKITDKEESSVEANYFQELFILFALGLHYPGFESAGEWQVRQGAGGQGRPASVVQNRGAGTGAVHIVLFFWPNTCF